MELKLNEFYFLKRTQKQLVSFSSLHTMPIALYTVSKDGESLFAFKIFFDDNIEETGNIIYDEIDISLYTNIDKTYEIKMKKAIIRDCFSAGQLSFFNKYIKLRRASN